MGKHQASMARCLGPMLLLLLLQWLFLSECPPLPQDPGTLASLFQTLRDRKVLVEPTKNCSLPVPSPGSPSLASQNRCVDAAEACTADARCQRLRTEYVAQCLGPAPPGGCHRARCRRALRRFFARGPPAITHALLFCPCGSPECAERRRQTFVPACAFSGPGPAPPSCLAPLDACEHSRVCRPRLLAFQAFCSPAPSAPDGCPPDQAPSCLRAYAGLVGTAVTPNYLNNASARVAPWCDCGVSGNRQEECEAFRGLFTRNRCLGTCAQLSPETRWCHTGLRQWLAPSPAGPAGFPPGP
ncbi:GDNF family receptor alpha-4 [Hipposideros larvatus]